MQVNFRTDEVVLLQTHRAEWGGVGGRVQLAPHWTHLSPTTPSPILMERTSTALPHGL